jgi:TetR/AcrR family fatty acid metabolism transcriptional regulator
MTKEELIKEFRVRELLDAARRVVGKYGFQGATIDRVAEEARVAKGTVYIYFDNKDELLRAAIVDGIRTMLDQLGQVAATNCSPLERLRTLVREQFHLLHSNQDFVKAMLLETSLVTAKPGDIRVDELRRVFKRYLDFMAGTLRAAIEAGEIRPIDPDFGAYMLNELITGSLRRRMFNFATTPFEGDAEAVLELFLKGVEA